jgi:hypothetical protein
VLFAL